MNGSKPLTSTNLEVFQRQHVLDPPIHVAIVSFAILYPFATSFT